MTYSKHYIDGPTLCQEIKSSNIEAFEFFYKTYQSQLLFYVNQYVKDKQQALDLVQDSYVALWETRENLDITKPVYPYIITIAKNKSLNFLRKDINLQSNKVSLSNRENMLSIRALESKSSLDYFTKEMQGIIESTINNLPDKQKQVFLLHRYKDLNYSQISKICNINIKTVEYRISKVLRILREVLKDY